MWTIVIPLAVGYILSFFKPRLAALLPVGAIINVSLILLLVVMGARIGADPAVIGDIVRIGAQGFVFAMVTVVGSMIPLVPLQLWLKPAAGESPGGKEVSTRRGAAWGMTLALSGSVLVGVLVGLLLLPPSYLPLLTRLTTWLLGLLLLGIGLDLGRSTRAFRGLKAMGWRIVLIPLGIGAGSIAAAVTLAALWNIMAWNEAAAVASGFGWYSLSAVIISQVHSPLLGATAFVVNVFRELIAIVLTPLLSRHPVAAIGPGGATTMDVLLPVIARTAGREYVPLAFFSGAALSLSVAVLVNLFLGL